MHKKLSKSPITYVLAQIKFTNIEAIDKYIPQLQEDIRKDYPFFKKTDYQTVQISLGGVTPITSMLTQWHFMDKENTIGILLDNQSLTIHTSQYQDYRDLEGKLKNILTIFNKRLEISLFVRLGLRYISVIKTNLTEYVQPPLLGLHFKSDEYFYKQKFLTKMETTQESKLGIMKVQSIHVGGNEVAINIKNHFVPAELSQVADQLSFKHHSEPVGAFLMLDIDHFQEITTNTEFNAAEVIQRMSKLQESVYEVFSQSVTSKALEDWK